MIFWLELDVTAPKALYDAARQRAMDDGLTPQGADEVLLPGGEIDEAACVQMLLDPGVSPPGTEIQQSGVDR